jgi:capsular polysaccharide biosynthesis protein
MIEANVMQDSNLIQVKVNHTDPLLAAQIANALTEEYLQLMTEKNQEQMSRSVTFLENQAKLTDKELSSAEQKLQEFQSQPRGVAVLESEFAKKSEDVANFSSRYTMAQVELQQLNAGVNRLQQELSVTPNMVQVEHYNESTGTLINTQEINPLYVSISQQLAEKNAALAEKQGEYQGLQLMVATMNGELDSLQADLASKRIEQNRLQSEVDRLQKTAETLTQKGTETKIAKSIDLGDSSVMVVSAASVPSDPIKPNKKLNVAIATLLGLMLFTLVAFILEYLDNTLKTADDISKELALPVLGLIPKADLHNS